MSRAACTTRQRERVGGHLGLRLARDARGWGEGGHFGDSLGTLSTVGWSLEWLVGSGIVARRSLG